MGCDFTELTLYWKQEEEIMEMVILMVILRHLHHPSMHSVNNLATDYKLLIYSIYFHYDNILGIYDGNNG